MTPSLSPPLSSRHVGPAGEVTGSPPKWAYSWAPHFPIFGHFYLWTYRFFITFVLVSVPQSNPSTTWFQKTTFINNWRTTFLVISTFLLSFQPIDIEEGMNEIIHFTLYIIRTWLFFKGYVLYWLPMKFNMIWIGGPCYAWLFI